MANVFISYNHQSESIVRTLVGDIEFLDNTVWFDQELSGGQVWWDQILEKIRSCDVFVFVLTPESLISEACKREYNYAGALGKPILPILVADGVSTNLLPPVLSQVQFVDYRQQDRSSAFRLARAFATLPAPKPLPNPLPTPPKAPISYLGIITERIETTDTLSYEDQSSLLLDLKQSVREPETTNDARTLLQRVRKRRDLFAVIAEEIDELLSKSSAEPKTQNLPIYDEVSVKTPPNTKIDFSRLNNTQPQISKSSKISRRSKITLRERVIGASLGLFLGVLVVIALITTSHNATDQWLIVILLTCVGGLISGAICGTNKGLIIKSLYGALFACLGVMLFSLRVNGSFHIALVAGTVYGIILGSIPGAIIGVILRHRQK